jgi:hypothetical protein
VCKKFCLLDVAALSPGLHVVSLGMTRVELTAQVPAFDNLNDDSSPDVQETPSPKKDGGKRASSPPSTPGEFLCFSFALSSQALMIVLQMLPDLLLRFICR